MASSELYCKSCDYTAKRKSDIVKHFKTQKHNNKEKNIFKCVCCKEYKYKKSFNKHKSSCKFLEIENKTNNKTNHKTSKLNTKHVFPIDIPEDVLYNYDINDPFIQDIYNKLLNRIKKIFTIKDDKIIVESIESMTTNEIDNHNLNIVNELINIAQEQQKTSHQCLIMENMNNVPFDIKYKYYKDAVKHIIFLYGDEVRMLSNMLISGLLLHKT